MTVLSFADTRSLNLQLVGGPVILSRPGIVVTQLNNALWRVTRPSGDVLGYVESFESAGSPRYRAKRMIVSQKRFFSIGEFWNADDAVECFRMG